MKKLLLTLSIISGLAYSCNDGSSRPHTRSPESISPSFSGSLNGKDIEITKLRTEGKLIVRQGTKEFKIVLTIKRIDSDPAEIRKLSPSSIIDKSEVPGIGNPHLKDKYNRDINLRKGEEKDIEYEFVAFPTESGEKTVTFTLKGTGSGKSVGFKVLEDEDKKAEKLREQEKEKQKIAAAAAAADQAVAAADQAKAEAKKAKAEADQVITTADEAVNATIRAAEAAVRAAEAAARAKEAAVRAGLDATANTAAAEVKEAAVRANKAEARAKEASDQAAEAASKAKKKEKRKIEEKLKEIDSNFNEESKRELERLLEKSTLDGFEKELIRKNFKMIQLKKQEEKTHIERMKEIKDRGEESDKIDKLLEQIDRREQKINSSKG